MDIFQIHLRELRRENRMTQKDLASLLNTTDDSIFSWEKGRSQPSIETIRKLCTIFDVSADYLIGLEDETGAKIKNAIYDNHGNITFNQH